MFDDNTVHLSLTANPYHLEIVDDVLKQVGKRAAMVRLTTQPHSNPISTGMSEASSSAAMV